MNILLLMKHSLETVAQAKGMHEAGSSLRQISDKLKVSTQTLMVWKKEYEWEPKGSFIIKATQKAQRKEIETILDIATRRGLTTEKVIDKVLEFQDAMKPVNVKDKKGESEEESEYTMEYPDYPTQIKGNAQAMEVLQMNQQANLEINTPMPVMIVTSRGKMSLGPGQQESE